MKSSELRELPSEELASRLGETKEELFNLRFQHATGQLENYSRLGQVRRDVARIVTVQRERLLGISGEPAPEQVARRRRREREEAEAEEASTRRRRGRRGAEEGEAETGEAAEARREDTSEVEA
jgi:large subunit ribosomal protein L29